MKPIVRCNWLPPGGASLEQRAAEVLRVAGDLGLPPAIAGQWFEKGRSKKKALSKPVRLEELQTIKRPWRRVPLVGDEVFYALDLWNGRDLPGDATLSIVLYQPPVSMARFSIAGLETDMFMVTGPDLSVLEADGVSWAALLEVARRTADRLGGRTVVTSTEAMAYCEQQNISGADHAAYAAFWGIDRSGQNPFYRPLASAGAEAPFEVVACASEAEVEAPDAAQLGKLLRLLVPGAVSS
jgi:hypothetical protein